MVDGLVADPSVVRVGSTFRVFHSSLASASAPASPSPLAYGVSLVDWNGALPVTFARGAGPLAGLVGGSQPTVLFDPKTGSYDLWMRTDDAAAVEDAGVVCSFNTTLGARHHASTDGTTWSREPSLDFHWDGSFAYEAYGLLTGVEVTRRGRELRAYYTGWSAGDPTDAGYNTLVFPGRGFPLGYAPSITSLSIATLAR